MGETIRWWLVVEGIGVLGLPIALTVFRSLPDRGYAFAKPLTILLGGYLFWLSLSLHILPNRPGSIVWCFACLALVSGFILKNHGGEIRAALGRRLAVVIAVEVVFTAVLFAGAHLRSYVPEIAATEKPMDFMYLNAASRSRFYPPSDAWLSGFNVSYYYFGYVIQAMLGKLAALPTAVTFNLGLASTAALGATAAFGLAYNLVAGARDTTFRSHDTTEPEPDSRPNGRNDSAALRNGGVKAALAAGLAAALFLAVLGNLEGVLEFGRAQGIASDSFYRSMGIANLVGAHKSGTFYPTEQSSFWWWWRATRISPDANSITEFPFFSFLLGDLHPHVMAIPFVLTAVAIGLALFRSDMPLEVGTWGKRPAMLVASAIFVGGLGFLNTWDLPSFGVLIGALVLAANVRASPDIETALKATTGFLAPFALIALVAYVPFYLSFHSQAGGVAAVEGGATRPLHAALFWIPLVVLTLPVALVRLGGDGKARSAWRTEAAAIVPVVLLVAWALVLGGEKGTEALRTAIVARGWNWLTTLFFGFAFVCSALALWRESEVGGETGQSHAPLFALMTVAYLLVFGAELFYVKDIFSSRLNTVFKLYYQAWLLLAIAAAYGTWWLLRMWQPGAGLTARALQGAWAAGAAVVIGAALLYPIGATLSRTDGLGSRPRTLDGLAAARTAFPDDISAAAWLSERAGPNETIIEAAKSSYSDAARVSEWSGVPAVIGWITHEQQWGRSPKMLAARQEDVAKAYTTPSLADALAILRKYNVAYVVVGSVKRTLYPPEGLKKFEGGLPVASSSGQTTIYRLPVAEAHPDVKAP